MPHGDPSTNTRPAAAAVSQSPAPLPLQRLADENMRRQVHEARQVVETWNSGIDFIHYGKNSELTGEDREDLLIAVRPYRSAGQALS